MIACTAAFLLCVGLALLLRHLRLLNGGNIERAPGPHVFLPPHVPELDIPNTDWPNNLTWIEVRKHFM